MATQLASPTSAQTGSAESSSIRYHGLDALRAWAMSLGIVLHAAWILTPGETGSPATDASATNVMEYVLLAVHTFRMQLFFLLAGFFACLLLRRRGWLKFFLNRFQRVAIPLALSILVLSTVMIYQYNLAGLKSGANLTGLSAWELTTGYLSNLSAGTIFVGHYWFLYYLAWIYVMVLVFRGCICLVDRNGNIRQSISDRAGQILSRPTSVFLLAAISAPLLFPSKDFWGFETDLGSLYIKWFGLFSYIVFFLVGWIIYRNADKLGEILAGWKWQLALGILLTVPYYVFNQSASQAGYCTWNYPQLTNQDIRFDREKDKPDYPAFRATMLNSDQDSIAGSLFNALPEANREFLRTHGTATGNQLNGLLVTINKSVIGGTGFSAACEQDDIKFSNQAKTILALPSDQRTEHQNTLVNREILEPGFPNIVLSEAIKRPYYYWIRVGYSYVYCLIAWLLVFGSIGFFQQCFDGESRFHRYFSDASYWFYLAHLPIQFAILLLIGDQAWHWSIKFAVYVVGAIVVLVPSYHFLIRPSWIGRLLNGRTYPVWNRSRKYLLEDSVASVAKQ